VGSALIPVAGGDRTARSLDGELVIRWDDRYELPSRRNERRRSAWTMESVEDAFGLLGLEWPQMCYRFTER